MWRPGRATDLITELIPGRILGQSRQINLDVWNVRWLNLAATLESAEAAPAETV